MNKLSRIGLPARALAAWGILMAGGVSAQTTQDKTPAADDKPLAYAIAIHGGAGSMAEALSQTERAAYEKSLTAVLTKGRQMLHDGATALDVVETVIRLLEDDPLFNAGRGAVFNTEGSHELDASIMDGRDRACGAVAAVRTVKNPIALARLVMTQTPHVLLLGDGAEHFADQMRVERVETTWFDTPQQMARWKKAKEAAQRRDNANGGNKDEGHNAQGDQKMGTVGCVALDRHGNLAAGTSTGGTTNKRYGRVGDSPIVGAGTYADNATVAVSCTGIGEHFIRHAVAYDVCARMAYKGETVGEAVGHILHRKLKPGDGGIIAVSRSGTIAMDFNTPAMFRGAADATGRFEIGIGPR